MKTKKIFGRLYAGCILVLVLGTMAAGCSNSIETEEEIITMKEDNISGVGEPASGKQEGMSGTAKASESGIAEQVQAPERYQAELSSENLTVEVDAPVIIPAGEGFKTYRVKGRPFEQADYDIVSHVLLKDAGLWMRDYDAMSASDGLTKGEIEAKIVEVPAVITVDTGDDRGRNKEAGWLEGYATVDGADYSVFVDNMFREDWRWNNFQVIKREEESGSFFYYHAYADIMDEQKANIDFVIDEIKEKATEKVAAMGFSDFVPAGEEYYVIYGDDIVYGAGQEAVDRVGYGIHFTRSFDGVPVTYTAEMGTSMEDEESVVWPYENLTLVYNEEGLVNFVWGNPYEVEKVSDEYLFLLPFSEIQNIFEEIVIKKYQDWMAGNEGMSMDIRIDEIRLGYMRVREKNNAEEATMIPVWDFLGMQRISYDDESYESFDENSVYNSFLTINALEGTIIDRGFGY